MGAINDMTKPSMDYRTDDGNILLALTNDDGVSQTPQLLDTVFIMKPIAQAPNTSINSQGGDAPKDENTFITNMVEDEYV